MKFINLASSSEGNCTLISDGKYNILIDCGISYAQIKERLNKVGFDPTDINAVFITHGHTDHISGLKVFMQHQQKSYIFGDLNTFLYIDEKYPNMYDYNRFFNISTDNPPNLKKIFGFDCNISIVPYYCPHDVPCVYYKIKVDDYNISILTDCGYFDKSIIENIKDVNYLMVESNYDEDLIEVSKYPPFLIERIKGKGGHLSNKNCGDLLLEIICEKLKLVCLSHISKNSNTEERALSYVTNYLEQNYKNKNCLPKLIVASRKEPTIIVDN